jgi:hypothetical protein
MSSKSGAAVPVLAARPEELLVLAGVVVLGLLAGLLPAMQAYRSDVVDGLSSS